MDGSNIPNSGTWALQHLSFCTNDLKKKKSFPCEFVPGSLQVIKNREGKRKEGGRMTEWGHGGDGSEMLLFFLGDEPQVGLAGGRVAATSVIFHCVSPCWFDCWILFLVCESLCQGWSKGLGIRLSFSSPGSKHLSCLQFSCCEAHILACVDTLGPQGGF